MLISGNHNLKSSHIGINSQWKVKHAGKKWQKCPSGERSHFVKTRLKDAYMPLFCDLRVMFAQFTSQSKFHVTLSTPGSGKSICILSEGCTITNNPLTRGATEIASLYAMINMRMITSFSLCVTAVPLAKKPLFSPVNEGKLNEYEKINASLCLRGSA